MNISDVKYYNAEAGFHFFYRSTMRFFNSRIESALSKRNRFITSESYERNGRRKYTVRQYNPQTHDIETVGKFMAYPDKESASYAMRYGEAPTKEWNFNAVGGMETSNIPVTICCQ